MWPAALSAPGLTTATLCSVCPHQTASSRDREFKTRWQVLYFVAESLNTAHVDLHWLPVKYRAYKLATLTNNNKQSVGLYFHELSASLRSEYQDCWATARPPTVISRAFRHLRLLR